VARQAEREALSYERYLHELVQRECEERQENRTAKMLRESQLPLEKSLEAFDTRRLPAKAARQMRTLLDGGFLDRAENALVFGNPDPETLCVTSHISAEQILLFVPFPAVAA
jgi:DNA replication protein DnaC